jgi:predicted metal-binding protein
VEKNLRGKYLRCRPVSATLGRKRGPRQEDLRRYLALAQELGVDEAAIVKRDAWYLDPRVTLKCAVPRCRHYDACANCPPHSPPAAETAEILRKYNTGILLRWVYARGEALPLADQKRRSHYAAVAQLEAAAFYDGYYFACGFAAGSCRSLCGGAVCQELAEPGKGCRHPLVARPSMEGVGFDVYRTAAAAGWILHPAGGRCPEAVTTLSRIAIVLIA